MISFLYVLINVIITVFLQTAFGYPTIDGPDVIVKGETIVLTCEASSGTYPAPAVHWYRDNAPIRDGIRSITYRYTTVTSYTFVATLNNHYEVLECQAIGGFWPYPWKTVKILHVHYTPDTPVLTGPTSLVAGDSGTWTCTSANGYPAGTMTIQNTDANSTFQSPEYSTCTKPVNGGRSFTVVGTLNWSPAISNNNHRLCCEVAHPTTITTSQSVCLTLDIRSTAPLAVNAPITLYTPIIGDAVTLQCLVTFGTVTIITWFKDGAQLNISTDSRFSNGNVANAALTISDVQQSDGGDYTCRASDGSFTVSTDNISVNPQDTPDTPLLTGPTSLVAGDPGTWTCTSANGYPAGIMSIQNMNTTITFQSPEYSACTTPVNGGRLFDVVGTLNWNPAMSNKYHQLCCEVAHPTTITTSQSVCLTLDVQSPPPLDVVLNAPVKLYTPIIGDPVTLQCFVTSGTAVSITWFKGTTQLNIDTSSRYSNGNLANPSLTIRSVQQSDAGNYTCRAFDGLFTVSTDNINVNPQALAELHQSR